MQLGPNCLTDFNFDANEKASRNANVLVFRYAHLRVPVCSVIFEFSLISAVIIIPMKLNGSEV